MQVSERVVFVDNFSDQVRVDGESLPEHVWQDGGAALTSERQSGGEYFPKWVESSDWILGICWWLVGIMNMMKIAQLVHNIDRRYNVGEMLWMPC